MTHQQAGASISFSSFPSRVNTRASAFTRPVQLAALTAPTGATEAHVTKGGHHAYGQTILD
jgi:hypothetical protein